jgi:hypothetical protein
MAAWRQISIGSWGTPASGSVGERVGAVRSASHALAQRWAIFDGDPARRDELTGTQQGLFEKWFESLRDTMAAQAPDSLPTTLIGGITGRAGVDSGRFPPICQKIGLFSRFVPCALLLHSRAAFGIALPLPASDRRHLGCGCSSVVEHDLAKVGVEGSSPFARSRFSSWQSDSWTKAAARRLSSLCGHVAAPSQQAFIRK